MAEYRHLARPDSQWVEFPNNLPAETRICSMSRERKPIDPHPNVAIEDFTIAARDQYQICLRLYRKKGIQGKFPLFIYMHGGGFVTGGLETDDETCRAIALAIDILIVSVEYRLAPEHKFPVGFEDSFDVLRWATTEASQEKLQTDLKKGFVLGGTSAGGNFTAGLAHLARDEGLLPRLTGLVFFASSFCHPDVRPTKFLDRILSIDEVTDAPGLTRKSVEYFFDQYGAPKDDKRYSPLLFESHNDLAQKAYFSICGWDPRRDEAILLEQILQEEGVDTRSHLYPGLPHGFWTTCPDLPVSKAWTSDVIAGMKWVLT